MIEPLTHLLSAMDIHPILIDIGAAGGPHVIWDKIARQSILIAFDPDLSETRAVRETGFYKTMIVNKIVTPDQGQSEVLFYFTRSPACSGTLKPDQDLLRNFLFADRFVVEGESYIPAVSLDSVLESFSLKRLDWFKADAQGTDLRLFNSLRTDIRSRVLAVDIEPGLINVSVGDDQFTDAHKDLTRNGFWLSDLKVCNTVRMRSSTLRKSVAVDKEIDPKLIAEMQKGSPAWCEARYFRSLEYMAHVGFPKEDYLLLWTFSFLDHQFGFCLDLVMEYENFFGKDEICEQMRAQSTLQIKLTQRIDRSGRVVATIGRLLPRSVKQQIRKFLRN